MILEGGGSSAPPHKFGGIRKHYVLDGLVCIRY